MEKTVETPIAPIVVEEVVNVNYPIIKSHKVYIHRKSNKPVLPEIGVIGESARDWSLVIGASFASPNSGVLLGRVILTPEEERRIMPGIIGVQPTHQAWDEMLNDYWKNIYIKIPYDGRLLEAGVTQISATEEIPLVPIDFILYRYCLRYSQVANSIDLATTSSHIRFYLMEETYINDAKVKSKALKDRAILARFELEKDIERMKSVIILSGNVLKATLEEQQITVSELSENEPARFLDLVKDKKLTEKAFVERLVRAGLFGRPLNSTLVLYDGNQIGTNLEEAVVWLNMPTNSDTLLSLRQQLEKREIVK